jgi:hypothetical protein
MTRELLWVVVTASQIVPEKEQQRSKSLVNIRVLRAMDRVGCRVFAQAEV